VTRMRALQVTTDPQTRRRLQAAGGLWLLFAGLLTAMSLFPVVLVLSLLMLIAGLCVIGRDRVREIEIASALRSARHSVAASLDAIKARAGGLGIRALVSRIARDDPARRAAGLNERGRRLRREGDSSQAAEQHRAALAIVKELGDRRSEALTRNQLGLALARCGAEDAAVEQLRHALIILRALGDEEHEARVIANLGFVQRRRGHSEEAVVLLHEALDKLPPESPAYRRVEAVLTRAG
jgi:tetratricopeptide (TPR) repeat protein